MANILIVDDSPTYLEALSGILHKHGHHCTTEQTGEAGIETALKLKPDLILMDVIMPKMSGFQATRQLAKNPETAPKDKKRINYGAYDREQKTI